MLQLAQCHAAAAPDRLSQACRVQIIGGPLAAALLSMDGWCGLQGWQWCVPVQQPAFTALLLFKIRISVRSCLTFQTWILLEGSLYH